MLEPTFLTYLGLFLDCKYHYHGMLSKLTINVCSWALVWIGFEEIVELFNFIASVHFTSNSTI